MSPKIDRTAQSTSSTCGAFHHVDLPPTALPYRVPCGLVASFGPHPESLRGSCCKSLSSRSAVATPGHRPSAEILPTARLASLVGCGCWQFWGFPDGYKIIMNSVVNAARTSKRSITLHVLSGNDYFFNLATNDSANDRIGECKRQGRQQLLCGPAVIPHFHTAKSLWHHLL